MVGSLGLNSIIFALPLDDASLDQDTHHLPLNNQESGARGFADPVDDGVCVCMWVGGYSNADKWVLSHVFGFPSLVQSLR